MDCEHSRPCEHDDGARRARLQHDAAPPTTPDLPQTRGKQRGNQHRRLQSESDRETSHRRAADEVPPGPWHYPEDQITDAPMRQLAAEITREKLYLRLHQELPYQSTVETTSWQERKDGSVRIEQTIFVERESQRKIVLGKGGQTIKAIGAEARKEIAALLEQTVHLFLFVKVREGWGDDPERYREMGLEFPKE